MALVATFVAVIAACSIIGMMLVIDATNLLTQTAVNTDGTFYADVTDACDVFQATNCG